MQEFFLNLMFPCANIFFVLRPPPHPYLHKFSNGLSLKVHLLSLGSLSNDDGDGNEDGKKAIGSDWQTTTLHVHHALHFFVVAAARLQRESALFHVRSRTRTQDNDFPFLFLNFDTVFRIQLLKNLPKFYELYEME